MPPVRDLIAQHKQGLPLRQAASVCGVHLNTVTRWFTVGVRGVRLTTHLYGGRRYVLRADLDAFLRKVEEVASGS
jgi:hypothetical protein